MARYADADVFKGGDLFGGRAFAALNDGSGMAHTFAGGCRLPGDKGSDRLAHVAGNKLGRSLFVSSSDLANEDHLARLQ